jgi:hypothetical protein
VCAFLATRVVFWDMRQQWLELLYRHRVTNARLDPLLGELNDTLAEICGAMSHPDLAPQFARVRRPLRLLLLRLGIKLRLRLQLRRS